jgi:glycosyltransferase involved in cell wall biosynthesis
VSEAIQSALDQSYSFKEVIVIDDGSTDGSLSVIEKFGKEIRWESGPNRGGGGARNRGLSLASGDYIQYLDADDLLDPKKLERQIPVLLESGADLVYSDGRQFNVGKREIDWTCKVVPRSEDPVVLALQKQNIQTCASIIKKEVLTRVKGFREDLSCCQERDLYLRLACSGVHFFYFPEILYTVRQMPGSVSNDEARVRLVLYSLLIDKYDELEREDDLSDERRQEFAILIASGARRLLRFGHRQIAKEHFATARKMHSGGGLAGAYNRGGYFLAKALGPERAEKILAPLKRGLAVLTG